MRRTTAHDEHSRHLSRLPVLSATASSPLHAMTTRKRGTRTFTHAHRQRLDRAVGHYLHECYTQKTAARVSELAERLKVHPDYLTRTGAAILGASLLDYLRAQQLAEAERLLTTTPLPNEEIALLAGFGAPSTFYRRFRTARKTSPGAFRKVRK